LKLIVIVIVMVFIDNMAGSVKSSQVKFIFSIAE